MLGTLPTAGSINKLSDCISKQAMGLPSHAALFCNGDKQTHDAGEQSDTFDEGGCQNHVHTDVASCFRLACDGGHGIFTDVTDTDTGADGGETCTHTCTQFADSKASGCLQ